MLDTLTSDAAEALERWGFSISGSRLYPRRAGVQYMALITLRDWHYARNRLGVTLSQTLHTIATQPFTGLSPEWVEKNIPWNG